jgi:hypothetical protein
MTDELIPTPIPAAQATGSVSTVVASMMPRGVIATPAIIMAAARRSSGLMAGSARATA